MRVYDFDLSMKQQHILQTGIILVADDEKSNKLNATLIDTDELDNLDEYEILWLFRKRSRESVVYTKEHIDIEDNTLSVILTAKALNVVGSVESEIKFIKGDKVYTTQPFEIYIRKPIDLVDIENELGITISDIVNRLNDINDKYEQLLATGGLSEEDKAKIEKALKDTADMKKEVTEILSRLEDTNIESLLDNIEEFKEELSSLSNQIINHYEDIQHLTSNVIDINNTLTHTYNYIGIIKDDIKNTKDKLASLELAHKQLCEVHENDVSSIKKYINNILDDYESVINDIDNINISLNLLEDVDVELKEDLSALNKAIDLCKSDIQANQNLINNINTKVNNNHEITKENLNSVNNDIEKINNNINKVNKNTSQQVNNIEKLVDNINNIKADVSKINTTINSVNNDVEDLQSLYKELLDSLSNISIPTKLSDLEDDMGYVTKADLDDIDIEIPTLELDEIKNDITLIKKHNIKQDEYLQNVATNEDIKDFITLDDLPDVDFSSIEEQVGAIKTQLDAINIPTSISELENDSGFITIEDIPEVDLKDVYNTISNVANNVNKQIQELPKYHDIPNNLSELNNDVGYITLDDVPEVDLSDLKDSINNINSQIGELNIPTALSDLSNDIGYITLDDIPKIDLDPLNKKINDLKINLNDKISQLPTQEEIPTHLSELENDTKFITKDTIPFDDINTNKIDIQKLNFDVDNINTLLNNKVDKITGKGLSTNDFTNVLKDKLDSIEHGANYYEHPNTHSANMIEETDNRQFVSLKDKQKWDRKATQEDIDNVNNKLNNVNDKLDNKLDIETAEVLYENKSNKGVAGGYVPLNDKGQIPLHHLPDISKHQLFIVDNDEDKGDLKANKGDTVYIINTGDSYIYDGNKWVVLAKADWENVNLDWFNIVNAPKSSVDDIDKTVKDRHIHSNKDVLDSLSSDDIDEWNGAYKHTLNKDIHVSLDDKEYWNNKVNTIDLDSLKNTINQSIDDINNSCTKIKENLEHKADRINVEEQLNKLQVDINNKAPLLHKHSEYEKGLELLHTHKHTNYEEDIDKLYNIQNNLKDELNIANQTLNNHTSIITSNKELTDNKLKEIDKSLDLINSTVATKDAIHKESILIKEEVNTHIETLKDKVNTNTMQLNKMEDKLSSFATNDYITKELNNIHNSLSNLDKNKVNNKDLSPYLKRDGTHKELILGSGAMFETNFKNDNWSFINNYTGGGWARGLLNIKNKDGKNYFQIGGKGGGQNFEYLYLGKAWNDWNLSINPNNNIVDVKNKLRINNKDVAIKDDIPTKVSQLDNDKGYITKADIPEGSAVTSVNGETGDIILDAANIEYVHGGGFSIYDIYLTLAETTIEELEQKADKDHTHNIDEFVHVGSDKPTDGRLWIEI